MEQKKRPYIAFYNGKQITVEGFSSFLAHQEACKQFKTPLRKEHLVSVHLADVVHDGASL